MQKLVTLEIKKLSRAFFPFLFSPSNGSVHSGSLYFYSMVWVGPDLIFFSPGCNGI